MQAALAIMSSELFPIVVPVDFSDASWVALERALKLANSASAVHVVHVLRPLSAMEPGVAWGTIDDGTREQAAKQRLATELKQRGHEGVEAKVLFGEPARRVADYAEEQGAPMVVVSAFGHSGIMRVLLGSVAERVVRLSKCDVLVVRPSPGTATAL